MAAAAAASAASPQPPPQDDLTVDPKLGELFETIEGKFKTTQLGDDTWYLLTITCLTAGPDPESAARLYLHLAGQPRYSTSAARQALVRRLREALVKAISLVGVCKPIESVLAIARAERPEDRDLGSTREGWQAGGGNTERAAAWFRRVYTRNAGDTMGLFDAHRDFAWISCEITYGFYLADRQVLDDVATEVVVLAAIMSQNLPLETHWHIRGSRRIGISREDTQVLWDAIQAVAAHFGTRLDKVPTVEQVEPDV